MLGNWPWVALPFLIAQIFVANAYSCKSIHGDNVDWFYAYKLPLIEKSQGSIAKGTAFLYADSSTGGSWIMSQESIASESSAIGRTVRQIFQSSQDEFYALYNDEHPNNKTDSGRGHMKGVLLFDDFEGVWLIHSVPNFPAISSGAYSYPNSGKRNGQSFLCITFPTASLDEIGKQLLFAQPSVYQKLLPPSYERLYPNLALAVNGKSLPRKTQNFSSVQQIRSAGGRQFLSFSKHKKFGKDLYSDFVAPELKSSLYVETWLNGGGDLPSECDSPYKVYNLRSVNPLVYNFTNSKDHSKWAVSTEPNSPWVCIGDINRQKHQEKRGGGTMCMMDARISALYRQAIGNIECCSSAAARVSSTSTNNISSQSLWSRGKSFLQKLLGRADKDDDDHNRTQRRANGGNNNNQPENCVVHTSSTKRKKKSTKKAK